jgi:hypothetical protein
MGHSSPPPSPHKAGAVSAAPAGKALVVKAVIQAYSYVILWMSISCAVILFNKVSESDRCTHAVQGEGADHTPKL